MNARRKYWFKCIAVFACLNLLAQAFYPTIVFALTAGPSQPEMQGFEPIGTTNMVDLASGSFTYNIPLMDVEGYPINLSYHSGVTMDEEASWVGLGWNINPGEINRQMRGLPDEFQGDPVIQNFNMKDNTTIGVGLGVGLKAFGIPIPANASLGIYTNSYKGPGISMGIDFDPSLLSTLPNKGVLTGRLGIQYNSESGIDINQNIGFANEEFNTQFASINLGGNVGATYNSRSGIKALSMGADIGITGPQFVNETVRALDNISFCNPTYTPAMSMPLLNNSITADVTAGLAIFGIHPNVTISGWFNQITLASNKLILQAYGYMFADKGKNDPYALHDFNREKDVPFFKGVANLPITNFTYDLFSVSGQGISGQFRPFRGDVGILYDHECHNQTTSASLGLELGLTEVSHIGGKVGATNSNTVTDKWTRDNFFASQVDFQNLQPNNTNYEPFYFKEIGEHSVNDNLYYPRIADINPMYVHLLQFGTDVLAESIFNYGNTTLGVSGNLSRTQRDRRKQCMSILNAQEATYFGLDKDILSYPLNTNVYSKNCDSLNLVKHYSRLTCPAWHTSEITVLNPEGKRYIYGIPAYNLLQDEATFSVSGVSANYQSDSVNLISYSGSDNSIKNNIGRDNYFKEQILPPYAHSYLLTGVLSSDYVDLTGDGITDDDLGEAVKFNYTCLYNKGNPYKWRVPFEHDMATYQMGLLTDNLDDKGNYIYGKKEVWYVHSIESKTMVAQFILENRADAFGVIDSNGGGDYSKPLKRLKEIRLYSKADLIKNGSSATPIKTVHFKYSYELCPNTPNSLASGKLTLTEIYFTYQNNTEGSLNSYKFYYSGFNPSYNHNRYDRWGYYKYNSPGMPSNEDFPYVIQDSVSADTFAQAWNLTGIDLPSGGRIKVKYESNDYAYVQNKRANQMFLVDGVSNTYSGTLTDQLYNNLNFFNDWIDLKIPIPEFSRAGFYNDYLAGIDDGGSKLYFRFLVDVDGKGDYEYVPGYADISDYQPRDTTGLRWAIKINEVFTGDLSVSYANPITLSAWQFVRLNLPQDAYPGSSTSGGVLGIIEGLIGIAADVSTIVDGFDNYVRSKSFGRNIVAGNSYIRLDNPNYKKFGGGSRVKEIDISDNWATMVNNQQSSFTYGQTYNYTTTIGSRTISSGVATYEPLIGGDENPCRQPLTYSENYLCAPNNEFYTETPLGESLYPAPGVVYSKVTVNDLKYPGVSRTSTGYTVNEFYTANDFPVINYYTYLDEHPIKPSIILSLFNSNSYEYMTATQGFTVETNDMPGKEKSQEIYDADSSLISSATYLYKVDPSSTCQHLNNDVHVVNPNGSIGIASIGKDIDTWEDMREQETISGGSEVSLNNEFFIFPFIVIPIDIPISIPIISTEDTRFRSAVTTKYIHRTGLLDKVIKTLNGSSVTTQNMLYDAETGNVLLTQTKNEFDEPIYNFTYPAHWAYDGMGPAYKNIDAVFSGVNIIGGALPSFVSSSVTSGDELSYISPTFGLTDTLLWVTQPMSGGPLSVVDKNDSLANLTNVTLKVIRSGRRNMAGIPIGTIESMQPPMNSSTMLAPSSSFDVLQATATTYGDEWKIPVTAVPVLHCDTTTGPSYSCIAKFIDSLIVHHQFFATPSDSIIFGKYCPGCGDSTALYYSLVPPIGYDEIINYTGQLGNCQLDFTSNSSSPISVYSTHAIYEPVAGPCIFLHGSEDESYGHICASCEICTNVCSDLSMGKPFNPYTVGMLGDWRPVRNYVYYDLRSPSLTAIQSNIWESGTSMDFSSIWQMPSIGSSIWTFNSSDPNWTWSDQMTMYDQKGNEIENKDALQNYSTALYGYLQSLPVAVASNSKYREIACDGFEDYGFTTSCNQPCNNNHWDFSSLIGHITYADTTSALSHTGKYSLRVNSNKSVSVSRSINYYNDSLFYATPTQYYLRPGGNIPLFAPDSGKYLLSAWVNENKDCPYGYREDSIAIRFAGSPKKYSIHPSGPVIEGWQQMTGNFFVAGNADSIIVTLISGNSTAYFDDIRIQPFAAEMKTYVYDPFSMRLMATLDENNYATFYEYNDEGILMRVKKETERGIMTVKETRASYPRL
jgi:hypothetical protein